MDMKNFYHRVFVKTCDKANIRRRRLHDTATHLRFDPAHDRREPGVCQRANSSIKVTVDVYGHFIPGANRQAVNKLPSLSSSKPEARAAEHNKHEFLV